MGEVIPPELRDEDGCVCAVRADRLTRGQAQAFFASERGEDFTAIRVRKATYGYDLDYIAEWESEGVPEPYDGWPLYEGRDGVEFWVAEANLPPRGFPAYPDPSEGERTTDRCPTCGSVDRRIKYGACTRFGKPPDPFHSTPVRGERCRECGTPRESNDFERCRVCGTQLLPVHGERAKTSGDQGDAADERAKPTPPGGSGDGGHHPSQRSSEEPSERDEDEREWTIRVCPEHDLPTFEQPHPSCTDQDGERVEVVPKARLARLASRIRERDEAQDDDFPAHPDFSELDRALEENVRTTPDDRLIRERDERIALLRDDDGRVDDATIAQWQATVDGLQARIEELARERDEARAEAAGLRAECEKRGLPVSAAALARHERNSGITEGGFNQIAVEAAEAALATEIESHENTARQLEAAEQQAERYKADRNILKVRAQRHRADAEKLRAALRIAADEAGHERQPGHLERCCPVCTALQSTPSEGTSHGTGAS